MSANHNNNYYYYYNNKNNKLTTLFTSLRTLSFLPLLLLLLSLGPNLVHCQNASLYTPVAYSASAILSDGGFYLYGGVTKFAAGLLPNTGTSQFLRLDLTQSFNTTSPPWTGLPGYLTYTMIDAVPSKDGKQFIIGGNRDNLGTLAYIYDIASAQWSSTPNLPGMITMTGYKRGNVGMSLDRNTGLVYIYGGFQYLSFSSELSILDTSNTSPALMDWTLTVNKTVVPALYEPFVLYLPTLSKTIVLGGCNVYDVISGFVGSCQQLNVAWLLSNGTSLSALTIETQALSTGPTPRYQSCRVVLKNGDVFVQGGKDPNVFFGDAWVLSVANWTWSSVTINGPAADMTRAGHACQMGPNGQIVIVGGFINANNVSTYVTPYMAVIDSNTWTWTTGYKGAPLNSIWSTSSTPATGGISGGASFNTSSNDGLSAGAKGGIGAGVAIGVLGLGVGFFFWRKWHLSSIHQDRRLTGEELGQPSEKTEKDKGLTGDNLQPSGSRDLNHLTYSSGHIFPAGLGSATTTPPPVVPHYVNATNYQGAVTSGASGWNSQTSEPISTTTLPTYPEELTSGVSSQYSATLSQSSNIKQLQSSPKVPGSELTEEMALAGALFQAEDLATSREHSSGSFDQYKTPVSSLPQDRISSQHTVVNSTHIPSAIHHSTFSQEGSAMLEEKPSATESSSGTFYERSASPNLSGTPAIDTPVVSALPTDNTNNRSAPGPQSVPEHEARIERSSPGVKTHVIGSRDVNADGLFPPLTPTRPHGSHSILVGTPVSHTTTNASSFSAAVSSFGVPLGESGSSEYFGHGSNSRSRGQVKRTGSEKGEGGNSGDFGEETRAESPYRDPQMMKDLDDIARLIETQTLEESKSPHAVVTPAFEVEKD
ncbi:hypothetical protein EDD21DRAFT_391604 [Dissophora ornata]|nr:hypothetical protein BGZ58_002964 [Dissophora ornata]KAI8595271.1 hypothetical protein EDD21DRAFT_391604 [Dissophora ornata]